MSLLRPGVIKLHRTETETVDAKIYQNWVSKLDPKHLENIYITYTVIKDW